MLLSKVERLLTVISLTFFITSQGFADNFIPFGTPRIDGEIEANEWHELGRLRMARFYGNDQFTDLWTMWDNNYLYISGKLQDNSFQEDGSAHSDVSQTWNSDSLEIYFHPTYPLPNQLDENSRVLAFTPTGKYRRFDRGCWKNESCQMTTGLEKPGNAINKINDPGDFFNTNLWMWQKPCVAKQPEPTPQNTIIKFSHHYDNNEWRFEAAIPWELVGTKIDKKIVEGQNCPIGDGVIPVRFPVKDGTPLWMNFYRIHADDKGLILPRFDGMMQNAIGIESPNGIMKNEWTVYHGDRFHPKEWQAFILVNPSENSLPFFESKEINSWSASAVDGRRVRIQLKAPKRGNGGSVYRYAVRYKEGSFHVNKDTWQQMTEFEQAYKPVSPGQWQEFDVIGLTPGKHYTFAIRAVDEYGINVLTVFVESLDLDASPVLLDQKQNEVIKFLDNILHLARQNDVYVLFRLYDTFYYKDDNFRGTGKKWSDTLWAKNNGAQHPDDFFEEYLYAAHKERMKPLLERYRDDPNVFGWDIVNEIDNKERFNTASYEKRKKWLIEMSNYVQDMDRNHLVFYSFLTWDPKDSTFYRAAIGTTANELTNENMTESSYLGMDAELAYRLHNIDMAVTHAYYAHIANPWEISSAEFSPPTEMARGISYGFYQIRDGRPMQDGESSPNAHLYRKGYGDNGFDESKDNQIFRDSAWLHFVSGGAGANLGWPADLRKQISRDTINQISDTKRSYLKFFKKAVDGIKWRGDKLTVDHYAAQNNLRAYVRQDGTNATIYLYNPEKKPINNLMLPSLPSGEASVQIINPENGQVLFEGKSSIKTNAVISFKQVSESVAVVIKGISNSNTQNVGYLVTPDTWINAVIHTEEKGTINAVWKQGGDQTLERGDRVIWGYFYANPTEVTWGNENNPDAFVKIWFDTSGRVDVNFFHVSVPNIEVFSCMKPVNNCSPSNHITTQIKRYARHAYKPKENKLEVAELLNTPVLGSGKVQDDPKHYLLPFQQVELGGIFQLDDGKTIEGVWKNGGSGTTGRGDQVAWGYFYADPKDVNWGSEQNPDVYVKFWYDNAENRIDVNFFHVSAPNITVYSGRSKTYGAATIVTEKERYAQHHYKP